MQTKPPSTMDAPAQMFEPPLLRFLRALDSDEKEAFAHSVGTTLLYLHQMIGQPAPNPSLKLALAIEAQSHRLSRQLGLEPLTLNDLLVGRIKSQHVKDHVSGETFTLLPNGEMARRRVDGQNRIVLVNAAGKVVAVEESYPGPNTLKKVKPLED